MLRPGEYTFNLPKLQNEALNWQQNKQALDRAMALGQPIREVNPEGELGFLQRERDYLSLKGWIQAQRVDGVYWVPPGG